jgi:hypothetical protein
MRFKTNKGLKERMRILLLVLKGPYSVQSGNPEFTQLNKSGTLKKKNQMVNSLRQNFAIWTMEYFQGLRSPLREPLLDRENKVKGQAKQKEFFLSIVYDMKRTICYKE